MAVVITYDGLPVSSGGAHKIRGNDILTSWEGARQFISKFARISSSAYKLELYTDCKEITRYMPNLRWQFGIFPQKIRQSSRHTFYRWNIGEAKAQKAAKLISEISPLPEHTLGPIRLDFDAQFYLINSDTKEILPNQRTDLDFDDGYGHMTSLSNFRLSLKGNVTLSLWLVLPYQEPGPEFENYIRRIAEEAPFPLSEHHWKQWFISKSGKLYARKLEVRLTGR